MSDFENIRALIAKDQQIADQLLIDCLRSDIGLINELGAHIIQSGGKRLRPLLGLLSAKAFHYHGEAHILLAAIIELLHTATLLHDDVVDSSKLRRGKPTANTIWGNQASVLVGDYLYSRAFELMVKINDMRVMHTLAKVTNVMAEGEVLQMLNRKNPKASETEYMQVIRYKTGMLFAAASQMGAVIANRTEQEIEAMRLYGAHLGAAFQLVDDALDYSTSKETLGKNRGDDLAEGKPTLPLIRAIQKASPENATRLREAITQEGARDLLALIQLVESTDAIAYTYDKAKQEAALAMQQLQFVPDSQYRDGLASLVEFAIARSY